MNKGKRTHVWHSQQLKTHKIDKNQTQRCEHPDHQKLIQTNWYVHRSPDSRRLPYPLSLSLSLSLYARNRAKTDIVKMNLGTIHKWHTSFVKWCTRARSIDPSTRPHTFHSARASEQTIATFLRWNFLNDYNIFVSNSAYDSFSDHRYRTEVVKIIAVFVKLRAIATMNTERRWRCQKHVSSTEQRMQNKRNLGVHRARSSKIMSKSKMRDKE